MNDSQSATARGNTPSSASPSQASQSLILLSVLWTVVLGAVGAVACSWMSLRFGELGGVGIWATGALGGFVARKITRVPCRMTAWLLVAICVLVWISTEISWIHWKTVKGSALSWIGCLTLLPVFFQEYTLSAFIGVLFTYFGAHSAYWQAGKRYRLVAVEEES